MIGTADSSRLNANTAKTCAALTSCSDTPMLRSESSKTKNNASRLLSAVPITPGGVGVIDLGYIGGLAAAAPDGEHAAVVGAVLMFRALTYGIQIPLGAFTYLIWKGKKDWRRESPTGDDVVGTASVGTEPTAG